MKWDDFEDPYLAFTSAVQGLRRRIEGVQSSIAGALGVGARIYAHQVGNLTRVLTDTGVRHLLADEVGLGKTVQALMVINALRLEEPTLRAAIVVPDPLMSQWRDELTTRAHEAPEFERSVREESARYIRLLWPAIVDRPTELDPARYSLLVVDELHNLKADLRDYISRNAARFRHVLILTATPKLQDIERHCELLSLLEPHRFELAARETLREQYSDVRDAPPRRWPTDLQRRVLDALRQEEERVVEALQGGLTDERWAALGGAPPGHGPGPAASLRFCLSRRITRSRRTDFRGLLPMRQYDPVVVEPTRDEVDRQSHMWRYLRTHGDGQTALDLERLARRALLSPRSLRERVNELRRIGRDPDGLLVKVLEASAEDAGDSRLDALTELLAELWRRNPKERVIVACQDSPTVDYLALAIARRLPRIGPLHDRRPLVTATARGGREDVVKDIIGATSTADRDLRRFQAGEAVVLFAGDIAQAGLNLQCARVLVLYSVPWGPEEIEQWIGRLDRIGNSAVREGGAQAISVTTITLRGLADERLTRALQELGVFERPLDLEETERLRAGHAAVRRVAFDDDWSHLERVATSFNEEVVASPLRRHLPFNPSFAKARYFAEADRGPAEPALIAPGDQQGWRQREVALEAWLRLLKHSKEYDIRSGCRDPSDSRFKFRTLWYRWYTLDDYRRGLASRVLLSRALTDPGVARSAEHAAAFVTRRSHIQQPPRPKVVLDLRFGKFDRPLQFLGHGSILHEDLVRCWEESMTGLPPAHGIVDFPPDHPVIAEVGAGMYVVTVAWVEPTTHVLAPLPAELRSDKDVGDDARNAHRADGRWIRDLVAARTLVYAERVAAQQLEVLDPDKAWLLLKPLHPDEDKQEVLPSAKRWAQLAANDQRIEAHRARALGYFRQLLTAEWARGRDELVKATATRRYVLAGESEAVLKLHDAAVSEAARRLEQGGDGTAGLFGAQVETARRRREAQGRLAEARQRWLEDLPSRALTPGITVYQSLVLTVRPERGTGRELGEGSGIGPALGGKGGRA